MKIFIDTNVLLDFVCKREGFYRDALNIFKCIYMCECEGCLSALSYITACYVARHYNKSQSDMANSLTDIRKATITAALSDEIIDGALRSQWLDKEDAAQYLCAKAVGAEIIITRNIKDFTLADIPVLTPEQFVAQHLQNK